MCKEGGFLEVLAARRIAGLGRRWSSSEEQKGGVWSGVRCRDTLNVVHFNISFFIHVIQVNQSWYYY